MRNAESVVIIIQATLKLRREKQKWLKDRRKQMKVVAEFEKPTKCEDCPCFYQTEGAWRDECQLTHKEIENYFIVDESCPLKVKENYE